MEIKKRSFKFKILDQDDLVKKNYSDGCSGSRSDCCTRVCTNDGKVATPEQWGEYMELNAGVVQY